MHLKINKDAAAVLVKSTHNFNILQFQQKRKKLQTVSIFPFLSGVVFALKN